MSKTDIFDADLQRFQMFNIFGIVFNLVEFNKNGKIFKKIVLKVEKSSKMVI